MLSGIFKGKTAIFIDAANMFYSEKTLGWRIDFQRLANYLRQLASVTGLYYYTGVTEEYAKQRTFLKKLESFGYTVVTKEVKLIKLPDSSFTTKGNLDVELALDAYMRRDTFSTFVLLSGDSDFAYLLDVLRQEGKHVVVVSTRGHISKELIARAKYLALPRFRSAIERRKIQGAGQAGSRGSLEQ